MFLTLTKYLIALRLRSRLISVAYVTSLRCLRQKPILDVNIAPHLPRFQVIEIEALSFRKNLTIEMVSNDMEEKILFRVESHVFAGEEVESKVIQIPMTKANLFLRIFDFAAITLM